MESDSTDFKLGNWWVRPQLNELERGDQRRHLESRSMEVLVCLARHAPTVVTKEQLIEEVWSDAPFVSDDVISHAIWELRKALGDSARKPDYIKTVPRRGYLLVAEVLRPQGSVLPIEGARIDHYDIHEEIGRGSMGVVFRATDRKLGRTVAIKFLATELTRDTKARQRFHREARLAASLDHPNLATVHQVGETGQGQIYLVTTFYSGGSLKERLASGPLETDETLRLARQLASGLGAAHQRGIVHRDIKPANLLIDEHGNLKIADFGIAKLLGGTDLTRTGAALGTPAYKSPEQSRGHEVDQRTDLWSLGVVLFEMLTGRRPFDGEYEQAVVHSILSNEPRALEDIHGKEIPVALRRIVAKAMAKEPGERFQTGEELAGALDEVGQQRTPEGPKTKRSLRTASQALGLALVLVVGVKVFLNEVRQIEKAADKPPKPEAAIALRLGQEFWLRGNDPQNLEEAKQKFHLAEDIDPSWLEATGHLALFYADRHAAVEGNPENRRLALHYIDRASKVDPDLTSAGAYLIWSAKARLQLNADQYTKALDSATKAQKIKPICVRMESCDLSYIQLAEALWFLEREGEAFSQLTACEQFAGGRIRCPLKAARFYLAAGESEKAAVEYQKALTVNENQTTALNELGRIYLDTNEGGHAIDVFTKLFEITDDPRAKYNLAIAYYKQTLWSDAAKAHHEAFEQYQAIDQIKPSPLVGIGDTWLERDDLAQARHWYRKALVEFDKLIQANQMTRNYRGQYAVCLAHLGDYVEAGRQLDQLMPPAKGEGLVWVYAARVYSIQDDFEGLSENALRAREAGVTAHNLKEDAAFKPFREHIEYNRLLIGKHSK